MDSKRDRRLAVLPCMLEPTGECLTWGLSRITYGGTEYAKCHYFHRLGSDSMPKNIKIFSGFIDFLLYFYLLCKLARNLRHHWDWGRRKLSRGGCQVARRNIDLSHAALETFFVIFWLENYFFVRIFAGFGKRDTEIPLKLKKFELFGNWKIILLNFLQFFTIFNFTKFL